MWIAISWLAFITISAIGANWLPYIKHSCSQYPNPKQCSTHVIGDLRKIVLGAHTQITLEVGAPFVPPPAYAFPAGL